MTAESTGDDRPLPPAATALGYAGLVPFAAGALGIVLLGDELRVFAARALVAYGAVILSFVGAVHWGLLLARPGARGPARLLAAVLPSVAGWAALLLVPRHGLALLVVSFGLFWLYEHRRLGARFLPVAYLVLRRNLTLAVCALLTLGLVALG
jgi:hypothetical protein